MKQTCQSPVDSVLHKRNPNLKDFWGKGREDKDFFHLFDCIIKQISATQGTGKPLLWQSWSAGSSRKTTAQFTERSSSCCLLPAPRSAGPCPRTGRAVGTPTVAVDRGEGWWRCDSWQFVHCDTQSRRPFPTCQR